MSTDQKARLSIELNKAIKMVGENHTLCIIGNLANGGMRFNELQRALGGINPTTLSDRLNRLEKEGILLRKTETLDKMSVVYELTEKGRGILPIVNEFGKFAKKFLSNK